MHSNLPASYELNFVVIQYTSIRPPVLFELGGWTASEAVHAFCLICAALLNMADTRPTNNTRCQRTCYHTAKFPFPASLVFASRPSMPLQVQSFDMSGADSRPDLRPCNWPLQCKKGDFVPVLINTADEVWWVGVVISVEHRRATITFPCEYMDAISVHCVTSRCICSVCRPGMKIFCAAAMLCLLLCCILDQAWQRLPGSCLPTF